MDIDTIQLIQDSLYNKVLEVLPNTDDEKKWYDYKKYIHDCKLYFLEFTEDKAFLLSKELERLALIVSKLEDVTILKEDLDIDTSKFGVTFKEFIEDMIKHAETAVLTQDIQFLHKIDKAPKLPISSSYIDVHEERSIKLMLFISLWIGQTISVLKLSDDEIEEKEYNKENISMFNSKLFKLISQIYTLYKNK